MSLIEDYAKKKGIRLEQTKEEKKKTELKSLRRELERITLQNKIDKAKGKLFKQKKKLDPQPAKFVFQKPSKEQVELEKKFKKKSLFFDGGSIL